MSLGKNIQFLRKQQKVTQEQLAEKMSVSRQTVSRWEADEVIPELDKLIGLSDMFACKLDNLIREDMTVYEDIYSEIVIKTVKPFRMGRYVMVTPNPEADYAVITICDPFAATFERIPNGYKCIMEYLQANGFKEKPKANVLACFEYVYDKNGMTYMDVYIHVDSVSKTEAFTNFS